MQQTNAVIEDGLQDFLQQRDTICAILGITPEDVLAVSPMGGMTNRNFRVDTPGKIYAVRLAGEWAQEMIVRKAEHICTRLADRVGIHTDLIYFDEQTGIKICGFIPGAVAMTPELMRKRKNVKLVAELFRRLHFCGETISVDFDFLGKVELYENLLRRHTTEEFFPGYDQTRSKVLELYEQAQGMDAAYLPCHNDPVPENFIYGQDGKMYLIDWEYGGMNDPLWDLAALCLECDWDTPQEQRFLKYYFGKKVTPADWQRFLIYKVLPDFLWSLWGRLRAAGGGDGTDFDYDAYGTMRYNRAVKNLSTLEI